MVNPQLCTAVSRLGAPVCGALVTTKMKVAQRADVCVRYSQEHLSSSNEASISERFSSSCHRHILPTGLPSD